MPNDILIIDQTERMKAVKVMIGGKNVPLDDREVAVAKALIRHFLESVKMTAYGRNEPSLYVTSLIVMHLMSQNLLDAMTPESLKILLDAANGKQ